MENGSGVEVGTTTISEHPASREDLILILVVSVTSLIRSSPIKLCDTNL